MWSQCCTSYTLRLICNHRLAEEMERRYRAKGNISFFEGRGVSSIDAFSSFLSLVFFHPRFILLFLVSSGREDYNQRAHKGAFTVLFSPPVLVSSDFFEGER